MRETCPIQRTGAESGTMIQRLIKSSVLLTLSVAAFIGVSPSTASGVELAARPTEGIDEVTPARDPDKFRKSGNAVLGIQKALRDLGFYLGGIDGHLNEETRAAIRVYQEGAGLEVDGKVTRQLWDLLLNTQQVHKLLKRLDSARSAGKKNARAALLAHPATRDLIKKNDDERADPTRDSKDCFMQPTVRCLLSAASENVKAVFKPELRDWALGEILVAQSRAGLTEAAMQTASRMHDPRLIMVALRDIAEGQAAAGFADDAREAARIIPDVEKRAEALVAIAEIQVRRGDHKDAGQNIEQLAGVLDQIKSETKRISLDARIAVILMKSGNTEGAAEYLAEAETRARTKTSDQERPMALRYVAAALAETEHPDLALNMLGDIETPSERTSVLISMAEAQARSGDAAAALATADTIDAVRYRAVVLGRIALSQAGRKNFEASEATLDMALAAVDKITLPYARSFAISRIALSMAKVGSLDTNSTNTENWSRFNRAAEVADGIDDSRLRAHTLWTISTAQHHGGDQEGSNKTKLLAKKASDDIKSRLTRVWMYSELAGENVQSRDMPAAWDAFESGISIAKDIDNPWGRSRALAKLAQTLIELVTHGTERKNNP